MIECADMELAEDGNKTQLMPVDKSNITEDANSIGGNNDESINLDRCEEFHDRLLLKVPTASSYQTHSSSAAIISLITNGSTLNFRVTSHPLVNRRKLCTKTDDIDDLMNILKAQILQNSI